MCDIVIDPESGSVRLKSRHSGHERAALGYICFVCHSNDVYSNVKENRIQCNNCGKRWAYKEFLQDCDFVIGESENELPNL